MPGFKTEAQVTDNLGTLDKGPLPQETMGEIETVLSGFGDAQRRHHVLTRSA